MNNFFQVFLKFHKATHKSSFFIMARGLTRYVGRFSFRIFNVISIIVILGPNHAEKLLCFCMIFNS